ncbi:MAG: signal peptidase II [Pseudomonadota bacterium]|uniref:signal peptidase II n=1 Tax=Roseovarius TaxID=74030 RepID=UPI0022A66CD7|nr:signal peptidase II [Roseovarius sp. EGI FJ00037]MCZ0811186.1 signal peptidase II [Roseovarius sp. EGI FJ00037]
MRVVLRAGLLTLLLDQVTKYWIVHALNLRELGSLDVFPPYLNLRMAWNYGINFGLMSGGNPVMRWVLIAVALLISGLVLWWVHRDQGGRWQMLSAGLLIGGAIGNVIDRLLYGAVADFINMSCCGINNPFAFNVADIAVFAGAIGLVLFSPPAKNAS